MANEVCPSCGTLHAQGLSRCGHCGNIQCSTRCGHSSCRNCGRNNDWRGITEQEKEQLRR